MLEAPLAQATSRSGRVLKSRLSVVDGQQVLRANRDETLQKRIAAEVGARPKPAWSGTTFL